jgi:uncharacterized protein (DUF58 family)
MGALGVGFLIAVLLVLAVINDWNAADGLIVSLALLLMVAWVWSRLSLQRLGFTRELSTDRIRAGDTIEEVLTVRNHARLPKLWLELRDYSTLPGHVASRAMHLSGGRDVRWTVRSVCERRGRFRLGPVSISSGDPFGLYQQSQEIPGVHELLVLPPQVDVSMIGFAADQLSGGNPVAAIAEATSPSIAGLREYTPGDPLNRISWGATARRGRMMVKEFEPDPTADIVLMVDLQAASLRPVSGMPGAPAGVVMDSTEDVAVAVTASLAERALGEARKVGLVVNRAMPVRLLPDANQRQWLRIFETLAVATSFGERPLAEAIAAESPRLTRMSSVVIVTATRDRSWVTAVRSLTERRVPVSVVLIDDAWDDEDVAQVDALEMDLVGTRAHVTRYPAAAGVSMRPAMPLVA